MWTIYRTTKMLQRLFIFYTVLSMLSLPFYAVLPIVHVPTWDILRTPTALIAAMACIGSIFVDSSDAWENSLLLSEICSYVIVWQV